MLLRLSLLCALLIAVAPVNPAAAAPRRTDPRADALYRSALGRLSHSTIETRRTAIEDLEQATLLDPGCAECQLLLARTYFDCGFLKLAEHRFERVTSIAPDDADGRFGLGQVWRRDWLKYLEAPSLDRAIENYSLAARLRPKVADAWINLVPLLLARGDTQAAFAAATQAVDADPRRPEAVLALAHIAYRLGHVHDADSLFSIAIPRLPRLARARFEDISPVASERDTADLHHLPAAGQKAFIEHFWHDNDPDPTSVENEARLEYWSRVAQAYFLYFSAKRKEWDERGEIYVRYGPPKRAEYNPIGERLSYSFSTGPEYPLNVLAWDYPDLGMHVKLQDRLLSEYYLLPINLDHDMDPQPDPDSLARRDDQLATADGRGVFPKLPPGVVPIEVTGRLARFVGEGGPRLVADVEAPGAPGDSLWAEWVVFDSSRVEVARGARPLSPSACDPAELRVADFAGNIAPGRYLVGISVRDGGKRRGVFREQVDLGETHEELALSDVVVSCGTPAVGSGSEMRIEPNARGIVAAGAALTAYFEIYHLVPGDDGQSRFEYECTVRSTDRDPRVWVQRIFRPRTRIPEIATRRSAENFGPLRRQFVSVPVQALPPGHYRLDITVRDLVAGREVNAGAAFLKQGAPAN